MSGRWLVAAAVPLLVAILSGRAAPADPPPAPAPAVAAEVANRVQRAKKEDAADLKKVLEWADKNGLERTADADWERVLDFDPSDEHARKRLRYVRREGSWLRDRASMMLLQSEPESHPERVPAYEARRRADFERPSAARHREIARYCLDVGLPAAAEEQFRAALDADPDDVWSRLAVGDVPDPDDGWIAAQVRVRRISDARARATVRRLMAIRSDAIRQDAEVPLSSVAGISLSLWQLREWDLVTDLPDDAAAMALEAVDLGARWFREFFGIPAAEPILPGRGEFNVLSTAELYAKVIAGHPGISAGEKAFAKGLGAFPLRHLADRGTWSVVIERPSGPGAADVCLHYAIHFLMQARFGVEAQEAWLYEGLAAYAVSSIIGTHDSWCVRMEPTVGKYGEAGIPDPSEWPSIIHSLVVRHEDYPMKGLIGVAPNGLDGDMLVKSWSILRWLLEDRPDDARVFLAAKRHGISTPTAIRIATGMTLDAFEEIWRGWVLSIGPE